MKVSHLTDKVLLEEVLYWTKREREALSQVLWRLKEIEERRLFSDLKCSSLYEFCVKVLKYSEGQASRRVTATRLLRTVPQIGEFVRTGELNLTQLNQAKTFFDDERIRDSGKKLEILELIKGKTTKETDKILWKLKEVQTPRKVQLTLLEETVEELRKLKALKAHSCPNMDILLSKMCAEVGKLWSPTLVRRNRKIGEGRSRYVQVAVKAEVWERDQGKCVNCGSTYGLQLDHREPFAMGGKTTVENLRLLCQSCNLKKGADFFRTSSSAFSKA